MGGRGWGNLPKTIWDMPYRGNRFVLVLEDSLAPVGVGVGCVCVCVCVVGGWGLRAAAGSTLR